MLRRTPALTRQAQALFIAECREFGGWEPGGTTTRIAEATGLNQKQVRDAIFGISADDWRRALTPDDWRRTAPLGGTLNART